MPTGTFTLADATGTLVIPPSGTSGTASRGPYDLPFLGLWGRIVDVSVTLNGLTHTLPDDLDFLLLGPGGRNLLFWSDAGSATDITNGDFTIRDSGTSLLPEPAIISGTYKPTDYTSSGGSVESAANWGLSPSITINHPGAVGTATFASAFGGAWVDNTSWSLYVTDDAGGDVGSLASWRVQITYNIISGT